MPNEQNDKPLRVAVVGACASGKSSLVTALRSAGYEARHVAQEHSYVPDMWHKISDPDVLIYLDVDLEAIRHRRPRLDFEHEHLLEQKRRLNHAREHCSLYIETSTKSLDEVQKMAFSFLAKK